MKIPVFIEDSEEYDLSSSVVRNNIYKLQTTTNSSNRIKIQDTIIKSIGLPVYCYLKYLNYLIENRYYGKKCEPDFSLNEEIKSISEISISADGDGDGGEGDDSVSMEKTDSDYRIDLSVGNIDDIPEEDRNIFIDINTDIRFDSRTIDNAVLFDKMMNSLISCKKYDKKDINYKKVKAYLKNIYDKGIYYILNDLYYFKVYKIDSVHCFVQDLFSHGDKNINLLENVPLLTTKNFNDEYLSEKGETDKIVTLTADKDKYLNTIDASDYRDYDGEKIDKNMVDDILGFLYESERYSLYLYLIQEGPKEGKEILIKLYSTVVEQKNDKVDSIFRTLNEDLTSTLQQSKSKSKGKSTKESKLMESLKKASKRAKGSDAPMGPEELLNSVEYVKQKSNGDGNCFYNSIGMLSSNYMITKEEYEEYVKLDLEHKYEIQFNLQVKVRTELTAFLTKIYNLIKDTIDKNSDQYNNSSILKYIMRNGKKGFKYVAKISSPISPRYYGSDSEIYFASLFYLQPIVTVTGVSAVTEFNIFYWDSYTIDGVIFKDYINQEGEKEIDVKKVINFLDESNIQNVYNSAQTSVFLLQHPTSYFLVGGRGHWSYAVNRSLLTYGSADDGSGEKEGEEFGGGGPDKKVTTYNLKFTKKIKNKYYKKGSLSSSSKTTKKHKKTRRANKNKDNILKNKKRIKKTIKQGNSL